MIKIKLESVEKQLRDWAKVNLKEVDKFAHEIIKRNERKFSKDIIGHIYNINLIEHLYITKANLMMFDSILRKDPRESNADIILKE